MVHLLIFMKLLLAAMQTTACALFMPTQPGEAKLETYAGLVVVRHRGSCTITQSVGCVIYC